MVEEVGRRIFNSKFKCRKPWGSTVCSESRLMGPTVGEGNRTQRNGRTSFYRCKLLQISLTVQTKIPTSIIVQNLKLFPKLCIHVTSFWFHNLSARQDFVGKQYLTPTVCQGNWGACPNQKVIHMNYRLWRRASFPWSTWRGA